MASARTLSRLGVAALVIAEALVIAAVAYAGARLPSEGVAVRATDALVEVDDMRVSGAFSIARVVMPTDGWVIVRAVRDGRPAELIGAARVPRGESRHVAVPTDRARALPAEAVVSLLADRGRAGVFEYATGTGDDVVVGGERPAGGMGMGAAGGPSVSTVTETVDVPLVANGRPVAERFRITPFSTVFPPEEAWIDGAYRFGRAAEVVVRRIVAPAPSWVAIVCVGASPQEPNRVVGYAAVPAGATAEVAVALSEPTEGDLTAVLCADLGTPGVFELDPTALAAGPDPAYLALAYFVQVPVGVEGAAAAP